MIKAKKKMAWLRFLIQCASFNLNRDSITHLSFPTDSFVKKF